jgi:hypothetical protein
MRVIERAIWATTGHFASSNRKDSCESAAMVENKSTTLAEIYTEYAKVIGRESLTDVEKQQAFFNAVVEGKRVEPFATYTSLIDYGIECERIVVHALAEWLGRDG